MKMAAKQARGKPGESRFRKFSRYFSREYDLYLMLVPVVLFYILFALKAMTGLVIAFKDYSPFKGVWDSPWVGLQYFEEFFSSQFAWRVIRNTLTISLTSLVFGFPAPILLALLLNELSSRKFQKAVQTVTYVPHFISAVVVCGIVINFLSPTSGVVNAVLEAFGQEPVYFLAQPGFFVVIYTLMSIWKSTGYGSIVYIAALTSIPQDLYEAAQADGAGRWRQFVHVTLPGLLPTITIMLLIQLGGILNVGYESIILLYNPGIYETADVINSYVYRTGILEGHYDYATAVGLFNSAVALVLVLGANKLSNKLTETGLW